MLFPAPLGPTRAVVLPTGARKLTVSNNEGEGYVEAIVSKYPFDLRDLEVACLLHDVGKIKTPDVILLKAAKLNQAHQRISALEALKLELQQQASQRQQQDCNALPWFHGWKL